VAGKAGFQLVELALLGAKVGQGTRVRRIGSPDEIVQDVHERGRLQALVPLQLEVEIVVVA
jgi:hypothetical protein